MHACIGCCECEKARHCIFDDDFTAVCDKFLEADLVVFATPMYYFGFSFESGYELMLDYLDWKDVGRVLAPGVHMEKAVEGIRYPADAYELGKKIYQGTLPRHSAKFQLLSIYGAFSRQWPGVAQCLHCYIYNC